MIKNFFLSLALSGIGFGCYIYFIKNKSVKKKEKKEKKEESNGEISDEEDFKTPIILNETTSDESYESCEDDISLKDMERYQIVLYKDPFITNNNWEFVN